MSASPTGPRSMIRIEYEDGRVVQLPHSGAGLLTLAGTGALDTLIAAVEPLRVAPEGES